VKRICRLDVYDENPLATGSVSRSTATMGVFRVADMAARVPAELPAWITSTFRRINSSA
jgi:hypothetical protein